MPQQSPLSLAQRVAIQYYRAKLNLLNAISPRLAANEALDLFTRPYASGGRRKPSAFMQRAETLKLQSGGLTLHGYKWRVASDNARRLLVIHGFGGRVGSFERLMSGALRQGYDVYAYSAPGHGLSEGRRLNVVTYTEAILDTHAAHGPFDGFIAHSLGGLTLMLALHKLQPPAHTKVVLLAPATEGSTAADNFFRFLQLPADLREAFEDKVREARGVPLQWYSISRVLHEVPARILWIHDQDDDTTPIRDVYPLAAQKPPHVHFHFTEGLGHSGVYRDNRIRKLILEFLGSGAPEAAS